ncbi:MAG: TonB-dependent receptor [Ferruginibacter sp.]
MKNNKTRNTASKRGFLKVLLLMKLTIILLLFSLQLSANVFSQNRITLNIKSVALKAALQQIEKKSDYRFLYNDDVVRSSSRVDIAADNILITEVLDKLFNDIGLSYHILNNNLVVITDKNKPTNDVAVTGKVTSANGDPIPFATIRVKGTTAGTSTDAKGDYHISVPEDAVLVFSSVGYEDVEVAVGGRAVIDVVLKTSTKSLDQVIVVGYGTQRKKDLTGSISSISGAEIAKQPALTATQAIQGKVAGVQIISSGAPNSAPIVRIRGTGSILAGVNPLYVVDGVFTDDIRNINSADITSMEVLKDASSAAIYGVRAANGVILITTKKGKTGKAVISYDATAGLREASHLVKMANSTQYAKYINDASANIFGGVLIDSSLRSTNTDWFATILRKAFYQNHNISISGGSDKVSYFFSAGIYNEDGVVIDNSFQRITLRSNNEYRLSDKFKLNTQLSYSRGVTQDVNLGGAYNDAYHAAPVIASKVNGRYGNTSVFQNVGNPLLDIESNNNKYKENRLQGTVSLEYKPLKWLTFRSSIGVELGFNNRKTFTYQFLGDTTTFIIPNGNQVNNKSSLAIINENNSRSVWDNTITVQKSFNKHDFTLLAGTTTERFFNESITGNISDVSSDPNLWYLSQGDPSTQTNASDAEKKARQSYLARLNYSFDRKYLITATFRADGSSLFLKHWGYFPSIGVGWNITKEGFMQKQKIFDNLKLRASWGKLGNDNVGANDRFQTLYTGLPYVFNGTVIYGSAFRQVLDKNIKWETTNETDIGLEFSVLKSKLSGELDFYNKKVDNALVRVPIAGVLGDPDGVIITNVASFQNQGIELALTWNDKIGKDLNYSVSANVSHNKNKILGLNGGQPISAGAVGSKGNTTYTDNGQPVASFYLLQAEGVFHNQEELAAYVNSNGTPITIEGVAPQLGDLRYKDLNGDGKIDDNDRVISGSYQPKYTAGLTLSVNYKAVDFAISLYGNYGNKIYNGKKEARFNEKDNIESSVADNYWSFTNYTSNEPRATLKPLPHSTYFLESGSFTRINNLTIGYTLPRTTAAKKYISNFRVYITGQNLATFTKYSGFTPELSSDDVLRQGIEFNAYPTTRSYILGVNLTF